ncbi:class I SAM-dependent methyltransferase [bacterium]|nr:class I SAM-dependent methyltransferase [bacterium]
MTAALPDPSGLWRNSRALEHARQAALTFARNELRHRREASAESTAQVMAAAHTGHWQAQLFHDELAPIIDTLPAGFCATEIGAGMGWVAALVAARRAESVLGIEPSWRGSTPHNIGNIYTLYRLAEREPLLKDSLRFDRDDEGNLTAITFPPNLTFAEAWAEALPVATGSQDFLYTVNCLEHIRGTAEHFAECARALRLGGMYYAVTEPLYFSAMGHHLDDIFPVPWGHLLWRPAELAEIVVREAGEGREWAPGEPLQAHHVQRILEEDLNFMPPSRLRGVLRHGPWKVRGWVDIVHELHRNLARELRLGEALRGVGPDELLLAGLRMRLERADRGEPWRPLWWLSHSARRRLTRLRRGS